TSIFASQNFNIKHFIVNEKTNNFWAATSKGLLQLHLPKKGLTFLNFPAEYSKSGNFILDVIEPAPNEFWVLTNHNQVLQYKNKSWRLLGQFQDNLKIKSFTLHKDIYITTTHGVFMWKANLFQKMNLEGFVTDADIVKSVIINNELWVLSASNEIAKYNLQTNKKIKTNFKNTVDFWKQNKWNDLTVDHANNIWLVGWMPKGFGICKYDEKQQKFIDIAHKPFSNHRDLFVGDYYNRIYTDGKNNVIFSAYGGFSVGKNTGKLTKKIDIHSYPIDDTYITGLTQDTHENVFFATNAGLHVYLKSKDKVVKLNTTDGLTANTLQYAFKEVSNNRLLLGGENQLTVVNYNDVLKTPLQNTIKVTKLLINGKPYINAEKLILNYKQNNVTLQFSTFSYLEANKIFYEYSVNNSDWISLENQAELAFNHLSHGYYDIKIRATDHLQNQLKNQLHYSIKINPPFTQSPLFYALLGVFAVVLVYGLFRYSLYRKMKEKRYELQVKDAEMRMLRAQMNPHFMFNTLNSINSYIIQHKTADASKYLTSFSKLMRNILESSKQQWITLAQEVKTTELYLQLEAVRLENSFTYEVVVDNAIDEAEVFVPPLIVQPFAENAIWHGLRHKANGNGKLYVRFILENKDKLRIEIEDNGIGRDGSVLLKTAKKHISYGVKITEERLIKLNSANYLEILDLYNNNNEPVGTKVILHLNLEEND
ncbi:MAG: histidine kinase, partial [Flavobacterium sp.]